MSKAVTIRKARAAKPAAAIEQDAAIVAACCRYTANVAAAHSAFTGQPDTLATEEYGAGRLSAAFDRKARAALNVLATTQAIGIDAIEAKARVVAPLIRDNSSGNAERWGCQLDGVGAGTIEAFAQDVVRFLQAIRSTGLVAPATATKAGA